MWIDLGKPTAFSQLKVSWAGGNRRATRFEIKVSNDASHWTTVQKGLSMGTSTWGETYGLGSQNARYVRLIGQGTTADAVTSVAEISVHP